MNDLPNELLVEIFSKLESPQVSICMMVNRKWNGILRGYKIGIKVHEIHVHVKYDEWAAYNGYLDLLKFAKINFGGSVLCDASAIGGQLEVLKWARKNGCPWGKWTCITAVQNGHLEVLKWARENGCPWDEDICSHAAQNGHLEVLKWARENGYQWNEMTCNDMQLCR